MSVLYAALGLVSHGVGLLVPVILVVLVLVIRPLLVLGGRTVLTADQIIVRWLIGRVVVPISRVGMVETRRGLLLEWPVLYMRDGSVVELGAPVRFWFRPDPDFDGDLAELRSRVGQRPDVRPERQWSLLRLVAGPPLIVVALALVMLDPPWTSDAWPLRMHARGLPNVCRVFDASARVLLPGASVDPNLSRSDDSDPNVVRHTCQWNATRPAPDGMKLIDVGRLTIELELDHGVGGISDAEKAHRSFLRQIHVSPGVKEEKIPHTGDEAELINEPSGAGYAWITVAVRKANVEEKIDLVYQGRARRHEATETAERLARMGLSAIRFR